MSSRLRTQGSIALELALLTPIFLALLDLVVVGGLLTEGQSRVDDAAHSAARAASLQRTVDGARTAAGNAAAASLSQQGASCESFQVTLDSSAFHPGGTVNVTISCTVALDGLSWLPLPGTRTLTGSSVSAVDVYQP